MANGTRIMPTNSVEFYLLASKEQAKKLTKEEEHELCHIFQTSDNLAERENSLTTLICSNIGLVVNIAGSYSSYSISSDDLIQEGMLGLITAIRKFDCDKDVKLSSYATSWIRQSMQRAIDNNDKTIRLPVYLKEKLAKIKRVQSVLMQEYGRDPTVEELAAKIPSMTEKEIKTVLDAVGASTVISLQTTITEDNNGKELCIEDTVAEKEFVDENKEAEEFKSDIAEILSKLDPNAKNVLRLKYGIGCEQKNIKEICELLKIKRSDFAKIESEAAREMRFYMEQNPKYEKYIRCFLVKN